MDWKEFLSVLGGGAKAKEAGGYDAVNIAWSTMDPHNALMRFIDSQQVPPKGANWGYISDPEFDRLAKEARNSADPQQRDAVLAKIHTKMVDDAVFVWFVHGVWPIAISAKVKGHVHPKSWYVDFSPVTVS
jgi:peptide/nickel transport system substrate-binding protein